MAEKLNRASVFSLKRRRFGFAPYRTRPDPYQNRTGNFFFLAENGYAGGTHAARQYPYPRGTRYGYGGVFAVPVLPSFNVGLSRYRALLFKVSHQTFIIDFTLFRQYLI